MKRIILKFTFSSLFALSALAVTSCNSTSVNQEQAKAEFICPMNCEDGKTYASNVGCPVCEMDLKKVD